MSYDALALVFGRCELVHGDLSEYNLLWYEDVVYVIDVGQSVQPEHPMCATFVVCCDGVEHAIRKLPCFYEALAGRMQSHVRLRFVRSRDY